MISMVSSLCSAHVDIDEPSTIPQLECPALGCGLFTLASYLEHHGLIQPRSCPIEPLGSRGLGII